MTETILDVEGLKKHFPIRGHLFSKQVTSVHAVDGIDFFVDKSEIFGLVGESGCGKTTVLRLLLRLIEPTAGKAIYKDRNIFEYRKSELREFRRRVSMIFQDPYSSLDPRMTVADLVGEPLEIHGMAHGVQREKRVKELLEMVGLEAYHIYRYPHEFSGGQKQRIGIARALASDPELVFADEPVSSLDISIRAQILNLMKDLQKQFNLTFLYVSHDLRTVRHFCDRAAVMYLGQIVELANVMELYNNPLHPYSKALISAIPVPDPEKKIQRIILSGGVPSPVNPPAGCRFHPRCPYGREGCEKKEPKYVEAKPGHYVSCHMVAD